MSATGRGAERVAMDNYPTPSWCVHRLLERVPLPFGRWLEPAAGNGAIINAVRSRRPKGIQWTAVELRPECREDLSGLVDGTDTFLGIDFLARDLGGCDFDAVISNPPYGQALEFVQHSLELAPWVVMLLRLNFMGSDKRGSFLRSEQPDIYVLPNRPSFTGKGTDATEYAWFAWTPERGRRTGCIEVLADTPLSERR